MKDSGVKKRGRTARWGGKEEKRGYSKGRGATRGARLAGCVEFLRLKRDFQNNKLREKWKGKALRG